MSIEQESVLFNLSENLKYSKNGEFEETAQIEMIAPTFKVYDDAMKLAQYVSASFMDIVTNMQKEGMTKEEMQESIEEQKGTTGASVGDAIDDKATLKFFLYSSTKVDFKNLSNKFKHICKTSCFLDSERKVPLTELHFDLMGIKDFQDLMFEYIHVFIRPFVT